MTHKTDAKVPRLAHAISDVVQAEIDCPGCALAAMSLAITIFSRRHGISNAVAIEVLQKHLDLNADPATFRPH